MDEFRIIFSSFLTLLFSFTATGQYVSRHGDDVTLPCEIVTDGQDKCDSITWTFSHSTIFVTLIESRQIHKDAKFKSDRLSVTEDCSLDIKKVTAEDAGLYICKRFKSGQLQNYQVYLSLITMTEHKDDDTDDDDDDDDDDKVTLNCSVSYHGSCRHTVKWLYDGKHVDEDNEDMKTSESVCSATVTFPAKKKSEYQEPFVCGVTDQLNKNEALFTFSPQIPANKAWLWFIIVPVGLAALLIIIAVIKRKRTEGNKTQTGENKKERAGTFVQNPAETSEDTADPEGGVSYASISYNKKTNSKARVRGRDDDDEGDTVTYSTVKASSSSAGASNDPSSLYTAVNKPKREDVTS